MKKYIWLCLLLLSSSASTASSERDPQISLILKKPLDCSQLAKELATDAWVAQCPRPQERRDIYRLNYLGSGSIEVAVAKLKKLKVTRVVSKVEY